MALEHGAPLRYTGKHIIAGVPGAVGVADVACRHGRELLGSGQALQAAQAGVVAGAQVMRQLNVERPVQPEELQPLDRLICGPQPAQHRSRDLRQHVGSGAVSHT